jgi:hypothetical protein
MNRQRLTSGSGSFFIWSDGSWTVKKKIDGSFWRLEASKWTGTVKKTQNQIHTRVLAFFFENIFQNFFRSFSEPHSEKPEKGSHSTRFLNFRSVFRACVKGNIFFQKFFRSQFYWQKLLKNILETLLKNLFYRNNCKFSLFHNSANRIGLRYVSYHLQSLHALIRLTHFCLYIFQNGDYFVTCSHHASSSAIFS